MKKVLGLDLGVASIGWALMESNDDGDVSRIIDLGSLCFDELEDGKSGKLDNVNRRLKRTQRRMRRRKVYRLKETRELFNKYFNLKLDNYDEFARANPSNILELKIKGLKEGLTKEELILCLYHYMKYRGFKSSRKNAKKEDDGKMLKAISASKEMMNVKNTRFITEALYENFISKDNKDRRYHNSSKEYLLAVDRSMYLYEIEELLRVQKESGLINDEFINNYLDIYNKQRLFSQGPDGRPKGRDGRYRSKYGSDWDDENLIAKMRGKCAFKGYERESRALKDSYSANAFVMLSALNNLVIKSENLIDNEYLRLESDVKSRGANYKYRLNEKGINKAFNKAIVSKVFTNKNLISLFKLDDQEMTFNNEVLTISTKKALAKKMYEIYPEELNNKTFIDWDEKYKIEYHEKEREKLLECVICKNSNTELVKKTYSLFNDIEREDKINELAEILIKDHKDDLSLVLKKANFSEKVIEHFETNDYDVKGNINLSIRLCKDLNIYLRKGMTYDKAKDIVIPRFEDEDGTELLKKYNGKMPEIALALKEINEELRNPVVNNTLIHLRKLVNAIIDKYGTVDFISVETVRDLRKSFQERKEIRYEQLDNLEANLSEKMLILKDFPEKFKSIFGISKDDLTRFKLYKEQKERSAYTNEPINYLNLFDKNEYEVDHIWPYSRTFDDSYNNKVLVETSENRNKGNRIPMEYYKDDSRIKAFISQTYLSTRKKERLLAKSMPEDSDFLERQKNDTSYITRLAKKLLAHFLLGGNENQILCPQGKITDDLKKYWDLKGKTHSYLSSFENGYKAQWSYVFDTINISEKEIKLYLDYKRKNCENIKLEVELKTKAVKEDKKLSYEDANLNDIIKKINDNKDLIITFFEEHHRKDIYDFIFVINKDCVLDEDLKESLRLIVNKCLVKCQEDYSKKDRGNDLHHALDACVIASCTRSLQVKITKYYQNKDENKYMVNESTGEIDSLEPPYEDFRKEVLLRVYERNQEKLIEKLAKLGNYKEVKEEELNEIHVLYPTRLPKKIAPGAISAETIFGEKQGVITKRVDVHNLTLKNHKLENIFDADGGNKKIVEIITEWIENKKKTPYPIIIKNNKDSSVTQNYIKTVKVIHSKEPERLVKLGDKRYAENTDFIITRAYKRKSDGTLFMVSLGWGHLFNERNLKKEDCKYVLWFKPGAQGYTIVDGGVLKEEFELINQWNRNSLIKIVFNKENEKDLYCYSGCHSGGVLEIYSILGDGFDIINHLGKNKTIDRYKFSISTIKEIEVHNISLLGKIS